MDGNKGGMATVELLWALHLLCLCGGSSFSLPFHVHWQAWKPIYTWPCHMHSWGHSDTTASFVWSQIIALQPSQLPYGAVETNLQRQWEGAKDWNRKGNDDQEMPDQSDLRSVWMWGWQEGWEGKGQGGIHGKRMFLECKPDASYEKQTLLIVLIWDLKQNTLRGGGDICW